jgi:hypothetical protein
MENINNDNEEIKEKKYCKDCSLWSDLSTNFCGHCGLQLRIVRDHLLDRSYDEILCEQEMSDENVVFKFCPECGCRIKKDPYSCANCFKRFNHDNIDVLLETTQSEKNIEFHDVTDYKNTYYQYINSYLWVDKKKSVEAIYRQNGWSIECLKCGGKERLQLHHNYYHKFYYLGVENLSDLDYLCYKCHDQWTNIHKSLGISNNRIIYSYYKFINLQKNYSNSSVTHLLLEEKMNQDNNEITRYFSDPIVSKYEKTNNFVVTLGICSFPLLLIFGIGIITLIISRIINSKNEKIKPNDYEIYNTKRSSLKIKMEILKVFNINNNQR